MKVQEPRTESPDQEAGGRILSTLLRRSSVVGRRSSVVGRPSSVVLALALWLALGTGCNLLAAVELDRAISMAVTYPDTGGSEVTVQYTVPDPPVGKVYVLWILNPVDGKRVRAGLIPPGPNRVVKTRVDFQAVGAVVSVEASPSPEQMNNVWALRVGRVNAEEPTGQTPIPLGGEAGARRSQ